MSNLSKLCQYASKGNWSSQADRNEVLVGIKELESTTGQQQRFIEYQKDAERQWEISMMKAVGEDGVGDVVKAIEKIKSERDALEAHVDRFENAIRDLDEMDVDSAEYGEQLLVILSIANDESPQTSLAEKEEPFPDCDTCGKSMNYMPWHYSEEDNRHLHACDECWPEVNPLSSLAEVRAKQARHSFEEGCDFVLDEINTNDKEPSDVDVGHFSEQHAQQIRSGGE